MIIFNLLFGLSIIGIGFFIKKYPNMIAGYNTMSAQKKKNVDIQSVAATYKKGMIIIGIITMVCPSLVLLLKLPELVPIALLAPLFVGILILTMLVQKYDQNKQSKFKRLLPTIIVGTIVLLVSISLFYSSRPTKVIVSDNDIRFTGLYGMTIQIKQIENAELLNNIPRIKIRTNGLGFGYIQKGHFTLDKFGKCRLFLKLPNPPYLYIQLKNGEKIVFNSPDSLYTKDIYSMIKERVH